jgi:hypothetical protein
MNDDAVTATLRNCLRALDEDFFTKGFNAPVFPLVQAGNYVEK